ncbi:hemiasterlin resistant protein 1 [Artemisia annua]|uniref:Hemiasterlin resistant protein 1 n=1 Tax=Artemisia annua TaxID=35608 RepID=A0A2U1N8Q6_ARTAN|nr:hemiasterlin resistant protein 1 [Artemisia annua]
MPRRSSGVNRAPPPAPVQSSGGGSMLGGIGSTIAQGMAFGTGSAVAHRAVDAVMGPRTIQHETVGAAAPEAAPANSSYSDACGMHSRAFQDVTSFSGFVRNLMVITVVSEVRPHSPEKWLDLAFLRRTVECINTSGSDISKCQFYMDMLAECRKNSSSGLAA